jgi:hypothetical protein
MHASRLHEDVRAELVGIGQRFHQDSGSEVAQKVVCGAPTLLERVHHLLSQEALGPGAQRRFE